MVTGSHRVRNSICCQQLWKLDLLVYIAYHPLVALPRHMNSKSSILSAIFPDYAQIYASYNVCWSANSTMTINSYIWLCVYMLCCNTRHLRIYEYIHINIHTHTSTRAGPAYLTRLLKHRPQHPSCFDDIEGAPSVCTQL